MRRLVSLTVLLLAVPAAVVALPVLAAPTPSPHPVVPQLSHDSVPIGLTPTFPAALTDPALATTAQLSTKPFRALGLSWKHDPGLTGLTAQVRVRDGGTWSDWQEIDSTDIGADGGTDPGRGAGAAATPVRDGTDPLWVDHGDGVQVRILSVTGDEPQDLRVDLVDPGSSAADKSVGSVPNVRTAVADASQPQILTRAQWGADESLRQRACPDGPEYTGNPKVAFLHHTVTGNGYSAADVPAIIRSIYAYHVEGEGWCDVGYNFLVDSFGRIWEGRYGGIDKPVLGAHTGGFNTDSFGVSMIGTFSTVTPPQAMLDAVASLMAWKLSMGYDNPVGKTQLTARPFSQSRFASGTVVTLNTISGHRDVDVTSCPGNAGYAQLPALRQKVLQDMGASGLVQPAAARVVSRTVSSNGSVEITSGMISAGDWQLAVQDDSGATVRTLSGSGSSIDTTWDMTSDAGTPVPAGHYTLTLTSTQNGNPARPWSTQVIVGGVFGSVDAVSAATGSAEVRGWALQGTTTAPARLKVTVSSSVAGTGTTGASRPDVAAVFPQYGSNAGYDITVPATPGYHTVCVVGDNSAIGIPDSTVGCRGVTVPGQSTVDHPPKGHLESARGGPGTIEVRGWALDPDTAAPSTVHMYVDGIFWGAYTASAARPDVGAAFPGEGPAHGFDLTLTGFVGGSHQVCGYAIDVGGSANPGIGCANVSLPGGNPRGSLEVAQGLPGSIRVRGWALDPDTPRSINVHVYVDGKWAAMTTAGIARGDVAAVFPGYGAAHGYDLTLGFAAGGTHQVCVYAINVGLGNSNPRLACRTVSMPTGAPKGSLDRADGQAGGVHIAGWALDPDTAAPINVHVYIDGVWAAMFTADAERPDVGAVFPGYGSQHGYDQLIATKPGKHTVCTYGINVGPAQPNSLLRCLPFTSS